MPRLKAKIDIDVPKDHVFAAAEFPKMPEWAIHVKEVIVTEGDGKSPGTKDKTIIHVTPRKNTLESEWTEFTQGEAVGRAFKGYFTGEERLTFTSSNGGTLVEWTYNYKPPYGILGKIGALIMMSRVVQNNMEASLDTLKAQLEV